MEFDPEAIYNAELEAGYDAADKDKAARLLEENKSVVLADIMLDSPSSTNAAKEMEAKASKQFKEHLLQMCIARHEANRAEVKYKALIRLADNRRTEAVNRRLS